ncbi:MAG: hypothetical protein WBB28_01880 [Crinalium sp.]
MLFGIKDGFTTFLDNTFSSKPPLPATKPVVKEWEDDDDDVIEENVAGTYEKLLGEEEAQKELKKLYERELEEELEEELAALPRIIERASIAALDYQVQMTLAPKMWGKILMMGFTFQKKGEKPVDLLLQQEAKPFRAIEDLGEDLGENFKFSLTESEEENLPLDTNLDSCFKLKLLAHQQARLLDVASEMVAQFQSVGINMDGFKPHRVYQI